MMVSETFSAVLFIWHKSAFEKLILVTFCGLFRRSYWFSTAENVFKSMNIVFLFVADKLYSLSSERDHARATFQAHTSVSRVVSHLLVIYSLRFCVCVRNNQKMSLHAICFLTDRCVIYLQEKSFTLIHLQTTCQCCL